MPISAEGTAMTAPTWPQPPWSVGQPPSIHRLAARLHAAPPARIVQPAFDSPEALAALLKHRDLDLPADPGALDEFCLCLQHVDPLQPDLVLFALPLCLHVWQHCLFDEQFAETHVDLVSRWHSALSARPMIIADTVGGEAASAVNEFMRSSILSRLSYEHRLRKPTTDDSTSTWIGFLASYGCIWPDIGQIFREWRLLHYTGHAFAALQYLCMFAYDERENPLSSAQVSVTGGGAPRPWDYAEECQRSHWLPANLTALQDLFCVTWMEQWAADAAGRLVGQPEWGVARTIAEDITLQPYRIDQRIRDVIRNLESTDPYRYWSDDYSMRT